MAFGYMFPPGTTTVNQLSDWITLDLSAADHVEEDGGMTENTSTDATGTTITTPGGTGGYVAWIFEPVDANGDPVDLSENSLIFEFDWVTQPAAANDGGLFAGMTASPVLSAVNGYYGFGHIWDTAAKGPDGVYQSGATWSQSGAADAAADGISVVSVPQALWDTTSSRLEPMLGGSIVWAFTSGGVVGVDTLQGNTTTNKTLGVTSSNLMLYVCCYDGTAGDVIKAKIKYRIQPGEAL